MPRITDLARVACLLDRDRAWSAYAIGDLSGEHVAHCEWHATDDDPAALILLYRGFDPPILFTMGRGEDVARLLVESDVPRVSLHVRPDALAALSPAYKADDTREMWRMVVEPGSFRSAPAEDVVALDESDLAALTALYDDGHRHGEGPTFFHPSMLRQGTFHGVREGGELIAVAGTHLFSPELGVCTVGNVYTHRDRRRRGLGARVTSAVVRHALDHAVRTIVLNVGQDNAEARRVYERLGFHVHCEFFEGEACRVQRGPGRFGSDRSL